MSEMVKRVMEKTPDQGLSIILWSSRRRTKVNGRWTNQSRCKSYLSPRPEQGDHSQFVPTVLYEA